MGSVAQIVEAISTLAAALKYVPAPPPAPSSPLPTVPPDRSPPAHSGCSPPSSPRPPPLLRRRHRPRRPPCPRPHNPPRPRPIPSRPHKRTALLPRPHQAPPLSSRLSSRSLSRRQSLSKPSYPPSGDEQTRLNVSSPHSSPTLSPPPTVPHQPPLKARLLKNLGPRARARPFSITRPARIAQSSLAMRPSPAFRCCRSLGKSSTATSPPSNFAQPTPAPNSPVLLLTAEGP